MSDASKIENILETQSDIIASSQYNFQIELIQQVGQDDLEKLAKISNELVDIFGPHSLLTEKNVNKYFNSKGNIENLAFAYKIAKGLKISDKVIIKALNQFKGLPHRQETVFSKKKILCIKNNMEIKIVNLALAKNAHIILNTIILIFF